MHGATQTGRFPGPLVACSQRRSAALVRGIAYGIGCFTGGSLDRAEILLDLAGRFLWGGLADPFLHRVLDLEPE